MFSSLIHHETVALLFPYDNALATDTVLAGQNRSRFLPSQQAQRELELLQDGMFPSSQDSPESTDPLAFCYRSPCLELSPDQSRKALFTGAGNSVRSECWTLGTAQQCDVVLPSSRPGPGPLHATLELTADGDVVFRDAGYGSRVTMFGQAGEGSVMGGSLVLGADKGGAQEAREALFVVEMAGPRFLIVVRVTANAERQGIPRRTASYEVASRTVSLQKTPSQVIATMLSGLSLNTSLMECD